MRRCSTVRQTSRSIELCLRSHTSVSILKCSTLECSAIIVHYFQHGECCPTLCTPILHKFFFNHHFFVFFFFFFNYFFLTASFRQRQHRQNFYHTLTKHRHATACSQYARRHCAASAMSAIWRWLRVWRVHHPALKLLDRFVYANSALHFHILTNVTTPLCTYKYVEQMHAVWDTLVVSP